MNVSVVNFWIAGRCAAAARIGSGAGAAIPAIPGGDQTPAVRGRDAHQMFPAPGV